MTVSVLTNHPLASYSTFGIGGNAKQFTIAKTLSDLQKALAICNEKQIPYHILGKGSNTLFDDRGFDGMVIFIRFDSVEFKPGNRVHADGGFSFSRLGTLTAKKGLGGLEFASGIPASVGGAVWMNAGANKKETCDCLKEVQFLHENGEMESFRRNDLYFSYRSSPFQTMKGVILSAEFQLEQVEDARSNQIAIIQNRKSTQPLGQPSAGCIFRNPPAGSFSGSAGSVRSSGSMIEEAGLKGFSIGGAMVSPIHANFVVNQGGATAENVLHLAHHIQTEIFKKFQVQLESEVRFLPFNGQSRPIHEFF